MAYQEFTPNSTLYHYCGAEAYEGITGTGKIWLTDLQHMNDPKELQLYSVILSILDMLSEDPAVEAGMRSACSYMSMALIRAKPRFGLHSFSLSMQKDSLPMWQEYTNRGRGYCIGFRATAFNYMPLRIQKVRYVSSSYFSSVKDEVIEILKPYVKYSGDISSTSIYSGELMALVTSIKNKVWSHEKEVRLCFSSLAKPNEIGLNGNIAVGELHDGTPVYAEEAKIRDRNGVKVPYHVKPFGRYKDGTWSPYGAIEKIVIGANNEHSVSTVRDRLTSLGYKGFNVIMSECEFHP